MIRELWRKLQKIVSRGAATNGRPKGAGPEGILRDVYRDLLRLSEQIASHAERAPYPHVAQRLRQLAAEKQRIAASLEEMILSYGGELGAARPDIKSGKNHWERMVQDLEDQKALEMYLSEQAARLADEIPSLSDRLRRVLVEQWPHKEALLDLVARADPQAQLS